MVWLLHAHPNLPHFLGSDGGGGRAPTQGLNPGPQPSNRRQRRSVESYNEPLLLKETQKPRMRKAGGGVT